MSDVPTTTTTTTADWWSSSSPLSSDNSYHHHIDSLDVAAVAYTHDDLMAAAAYSSAVEATTFANNMSCYSTAPTSVSAAAAGDADTDVTLPLPTWSGDTVYCHEWFPCSHGGSVQSYLGHQQNGPLLRTLLDDWRRLGSPVLDSVEQLRRAQYDHGQHVPADLAQLAEAQEQVIVQSLVKALNSTTLIEVTKPFSAFAGQLGLFSMIKAELFALQNGGGAAMLDRAQLYEQVWMAALADFDEGRSVCHSATQPLHLCLGDLIWGKAYRLPLEVLQYSYAGYLMQLKGAPTTTTTTTTTPSVSVHSWLVEQTRGMRSSQSWLSELQLDHQAPPPAYEEHDNNHNDGGKSLIPSRRGAMSPTQLQVLLDNMLVFWNSAGFFDALSPEQHDGARAESPEAMTVDATQGHPNDDHSRRWPTKLWSLTTGAPPIRTYSLSISPKGNSTSCCYEGLLLPLRPLPMGVEGGGSKPTQSSPPMRSVVVAISSPQPNDPSRSVSPAMLSQSYGGSGASSSSSRDDQAVVLNELLHAPPPSSRPTHARTPSARSNVSANDDDDFTDDNKQRTRDAGRLRSQRHHQRLMTQRGVLNDAVEGLRQVTRELWNNGCADTAMASAMMRALTELPLYDDKRPAAQRSRRTTAATTTTTDARASFNARKRDSKKKMRSLDVQNVVTLMRVAAAIVDVPLQQLVHLPAVVGAKRRRGGGGVDEETAPPPLPLLSAEVAAQNAVLHVWLGMRHAWADIVMAEKRFFASGPPSDDCVSTGAVIQLLQMGLR